MPTAWPTLATRRLPSRQSWSLVAATQVHTSPFNGAVQTQVLSAAVWATTIQYDNLDRADAAILQAFIASLQGRAGRITVGNLAQPRLRGNATPIPTIKVNGAGQSGNTLTLDGVTPGTYFAAGDFVGLESRLYMVTADVTANGVGLLTMNISPALRATPAVLSPLTIVSPTTTMMLVDDRQGWDYAPGGRRSYTIDLIEVL